MLGGGPLLLTTVLYFPGNLLMHLTVTTSRCIDVKFLFRHYKGRITTNAGAGLMDKNLKTNVRMVIY